jgi:aspartate carbamoyltransferase
MSNLKGKHILHGNQFTKKDILSLIRLASDFEKELKRKAIIPLLRGRILATLFFEPSTRTRLSFETAMQRLGGGVISMGSIEGSSVAKGESLIDTVKTISQYADILVIRHPKVGAVSEAANATSVPIINAGDGSGQHPTQALLDIYTIYKELGSLNNLTLSLVGDLKYGRTVHALVEILSHFNIKLYFVAPNSLRMPEEITSKLKEKGIEIVETEDLISSAKESDLIYMTRIQRERFSEPSEYERLKGIFIIDNEFLKKVNKELVIMHPLPRVNEISPEVDFYKGAAYFRQVKNGLYMRMALLAKVMGKK